MSTMSWSELYENAVSTESGAPGVPAGPYDVEVAAARPYAQSRMVFLELTVLGGPHNGRSVDVGLYVPEPTNNKAGFHFAKKIAGFGDLSDTFKLMDTTGDDLDGALNILADALVGKRVQADIGLVGEGDYKGRNELQKTKPAQGATPAAPVPAAAPPAPAAEPMAPVAAAIGEDEEVPF